MIGAWLVHLFTASGIVLAFLAARAVIDYDYRTAFFWLALQVFVDATDGYVARLARVSERTPSFDGAKLDDITDYLTYVFVPALFVWRGAIVPSTWALPVASAMLLSSAYGFNQRNAKTPDHFFTGFPSYWNIVVFYLWLAGWPPLVNGWILIGFAVLVFVPIRYVYPTRTPRWQAATLLFGGVWSGMLLVLLWQYPAVSRPVFLASFFFPVYYAMLSLALHFRLRVVS